MSLAGLKVLSLESRRATEMATLISRYEGTAFVAPSVKEKPVTKPDEASRFIVDLESGKYDMVICMTGVGLVYMLDMLAPTMPADRIGAALRRATIVARGPKPVGTLRSLAVPVQVMIPEPNTWREIEAAVQLRTERRLAVLEYGKPNQELNKALASFGACVTPVKLYRWELPDDLAPLLSAAHQLAAGEVNLILFTSSIQLDHLLQIAAREGLEDQVRDALNGKVIIGSIGPVMTESLEAQGFIPRIVPKHPKMPSLVKAAADFFDSSSE